MKQILLLSLILTSFNIQARPYICEDGLRVEFSSSVGSIYSKVVTSPTLQEWTQDEKFSYSIDAESDLNYVCRCLKMDKAINYQITMVPPEKSEFGGVQHMGLLAGKEIGSNRFASRPQGPKILTLTCEKNL